MHNVYIEAFVNHVTDYSDHEMCYLNLMSLCIFYQC